MSTWVPSQLKSLEEHSQIVHDRSTRRGIEYSLEDAAGVTSIRSEARRNVVPSSGNIDTDARARARDNITFFEHKTV